MCVCVYHSSSKTGGIITQHGAEKNVRVRDGEPLQVKNASVFWTSDSNNIYEHTAIETEHTRSL